MPKLIKCVALVCRSSNCSRRSKDRLIDSRNTIYGYMARPYQSAKHQGVQQLDMLLSILLAIFGGNSSPIAECVQYLRIIRSIRFKGIGEVQ